MFTRIAALAFGLLAAGGPALACTAVNVVAEDGSVVAGRTMEWGFDMDWTLSYRPKGTTVSYGAPAEMKLPSRQEPTKLSFVGIRPAKMVGIDIKALGGDLFLEGQNEAGLGMSANFLPGFTEYQTLTSPEDKGVSIAAFGSWALGGFRTVADLRKALPGVKVWADPAWLKAGTPPFVHFVFTDRSGDSIVLEFIDGEQRVFDNAASVLTNAPTYDWHLMNLRNYLNLDSMTRGSVKIGADNVTALGMGGGMVGIPGDYTPPSRFVRAAFLTHYAVNAQDGDGALAQAGHILNTVDIPYGVVEAGIGDKVERDYTQWVNLKDLSGNRMQIADYRHRATFVTLDLDKVFAGAGPTDIPVAKLPFPAQIDATGALLQ